MRTVFMKEYVSSAGIYAQRVKLAIIRFKNVLVSEGKLSGA